MKWLLYIFLLANLAMFFWHYQPGLFRNGNDNPVREISDGDLVPQLVLLREFESQQTETTKSTVAKEKSCFNLGPFKKRKKALQINKELKAMGIVASLHINKDKKRPGYWVLVPPEKDRKSARKTIAQLKKKNVKDFFLVATGTQKNAISLGVFSRAELAQKRQKAMKNLGFTVSIDKVNLPKREYWLEWPTTADIIVEAKILNRWRKSVPSLGNTKKVCQPKI